VPLPRRLAGAVCRSAAGDGALLRHSLVLSRGRPSGRRGRVRRRRLAPLRSARRRPASRPASRQRSVAMRPPNRSHDAAVAAAAAAGDYRCSSLSG